MREAERAQAAGEVPVGAVAVLDGRVIGPRHSLRETARESRAHTPS